MKQKTFTLMLGLILVLALATGGVALLRDVKQNKFSWQYMVITDDQWQSLQEDGGSKTNVYYLIDFDKRQVQKCEDKYFGPMQKYDYRGKIIYEKSFDEQLAVKAQEILDKNWSSGSPTEGTASYYAIEKANDGVRYIVSKAPILQLEGYMEKFDQLP